MEFFGCTSKKLLSFGYPCYDMMLKGSERADEYKKKKLLKETDSEKLILWMPTYRHASSERLNEETLNNEFNIPIIDDADKLLELNKFCKENHILIVIKKHYLQVPYDFGENVLTNIVYLENRDLADNGLQLYEFINCSDALVSDYSSVAIDYLLLDRPLDSHWMIMRLIRNPEDGCLMIRWNICLANICIICRILRISSWILKKRKR